VIHTLQRGHCFDPVFLAHRIRLSSNFRDVGPLTRIFAACSSHVSFLWYGCAPQRKQLSFLHVVHRKRRCAPSSRTRIGQLGVGQAKSLSDADTAWSRRRANNRSMTSFGTTLRNTWSGRSALHSGQGTFAIPSPSRDSAYFAMHVKQYHPWPQLKQAALPEATSVQQMEQATEVRLNRSMGKSFSGDALPRGTGSNKVHFVSCLVRIGVTCIAFMTGASSTIPPSALSRPFKAHAFCGVCESEQQEASFMGRASASKSTRLRAERREGNFCQEAPLFPGASSGRRVRGPGAGGSACAAGVDEDTSCQRALTSLVSAAGFSAAGARGGCSGVASASAGKSDAARGGSSGVAAPASAWRGAGEVTAFQQALASSTQPWGTATGAPRLEVSVAPLPQRGNVRVAESSGLHHSTGVGEDAGAAHVMDPSMKNVSVGGGGGVDAAAGARERGSGAAGGAG